MSDRTGGGSRYGYWFPLALLGFGLLALLGWESRPPTEDFGHVENAPGSQHGYVLAPGAQYSAATVAVSHGSPPMLDWPWAVPVTVTLVGTVLWYGWRARRAGGSLRGYLVVAVAGGIAVPVGYLVAAIAGTAEDPASVITRLGLPLVVLGVLAGVLARFGRGRWVSVVLSVPCLVFGVAVVALARRDPVPR